MKGGIWLKYILMQPGFSEADADALSIGCWRDIHFVIRLSRNEHSVPNEILS